MSQCQKHSTHKIVSFAKKYPWLFPITGMIALAWFLIRVIPKPSRALYPCQQVATPIASGFVAWLIASATGLLPSILAFKIGKKRAAQAKYALALLFFIVAVTGYGVFTFMQAPSYSAAATDAPFVPETANEPVGVARGCNPGRVVWVYNPDAALGTTASNWWTDENTDADVVDTMMENAILNLAGKETLPDAWDTLFRSFNVEYGNGDHGYQAGEKIAIKLNMNNCTGTSYSTKGYNSPQATSALIVQLVEVVGVAGADITVYDASRSIGSPIIEAIQANEGQDYQDVQYVVSPQYPNDGRITAVHDETHPLVFADTTMQDYNTTYLPACVTEATYLINCANLKGHGLGGVTLCAKNFFGSVYRPANINASTKGWTPNGTDTGEDGMYGIHYYMNPLHTTFWNKNSVCEMGDYNALVDLMGHEHLGGKVMLFLIDAIYGAPGAGTNVAKFQSEPFNGGWTSSIFASQDFVAIESVGLDFLVAEPTVTSTKGSLDNYLHEAAQADNPPSGTFYDPEGDGTRLASLGVHEHWNNATDKQYSRNLGTADGIELIQILSNVKPPQVTNLTKEEGPGRVILTWDSCGEDMTYTVRRRPITGSFEVIAEGITECTYVDEGLTPNVMVAYTVSAVNESGEGEGSSQITAIPQEGVAVEESPVSYDLSLNNYPNPFNPATRISYTIPEDGRVNIAVYNLVGQRMATLVSSHMAAGEYSVNWNGADELGQRASAGVYIVRLQAGSSIAARKITLLY